MRLRGTIRGFVGRGRPRPPRLCRFGTCHAPSPQALRQHPAELGIRIIMALWALTCEAREDRDGAWHGTWSVFRNIGRARSRQACGMRHAAWQGDDAISLTLPAPACKAWRQASQQRSQSEGESSECELASRTMAVLGGQSCKKAPPPHVCRSRRAIRTREASGSLGQICANGRTTPAVISDLLSGQRCSKENCRPALASGTSALVFSLCSLGVRFASSHRSLCRSFAPPRLGVCVRVCVCVCVFPLGSHYLSLLSRWLFPCVLG